jgi:hypothetical protein
MVNAKEAMDRFEELRLKDPIKQMWAWMRTSILFSVGKMFETHLVSMQCFPQHVFVLFI